MNKNNKEKIKFQISNFKHSIISIKYFYKIHRNHQIFFYNQKIMNIDNVKIFLSKKKVMFKNIFNHSCLKIQIFLSKKIIILRYEKNNF